MSVWRSLQAVKLYDHLGNPLVKKDGDSWTTDYGVPIVARDPADVVRPVLAEADGSLIVAAKPPSAPPGTTEYIAAVSEAQLNVGSGGDVTSPHTTLGSIIADGINLYLQTIEVGTEGDSSENGSVVEVYWRTSGPTDHIIDRFYIMGETIQVILPNVNKARDGTQMTGDGSNTRLAIVRRRLSVAALEVDFVIRGYTQ